MTKMKSQIDRRIFLNWMSASVGTWALASNALADTQSSPNTLRVGVITSITGVYQVYGQPLVDGLQLGIQYESQKRGMTTPIRYEVSAADAAGNVTKALDAAVKYAQDGVKIIAGPIDSSVAYRLATFCGENNILYLNGLAGANNLVGINNQTFQTARKSYQVVAAMVDAASDIKPPAKALIIGQDTNFGRSGYEALKPLLEAKGYQVSSLFGAASTTAFGPLMQKIRQINPNVIFSNWVGDKIGGLFTAIHQQHLDRDYPIITELQGRAQWPSYGAAGPFLRLVSSYESTAVENDANKYFVSHTETVDLLAGVSGFTAGQMVVQATTNGKYKDTEAMIKALEGWEFQNPQGTVSIRKSDHLLAMPMLLVKFTKMDSDPLKTSVAVVRMIPAAVVAPPAKS